MPITPVSLPYLDGQGLDAALLNRARAAIYAEVVAGSSTTAAAGPSPSDAATASSSTASVGGPLHPKVLAMIARNSSAAGEKPTAAASDDTPNTHTASSSSFDDEQRLAIRQEYARGLKVRTVAVSEALSGGIVDDRVAALESTAAALRRRRVEVVRATEDINAKRCLVQACCLVEGGAGRAGEVAERLIEAGTL